MGFEPSGTGYKVAKFTNSSLEKDRPKPDGMDYFDTALPEDATDSIAKWIADNVDIHKL